MITPPPPKITTSEEVLQKLDEGWWLFTNETNPLVHANRRSVRIKFMAWLKKPEQDGIFIVKKVFTNLKKQGKIKRVPNDVEGNLLRRARYAKA